MQIKRTQIICIQHVFKVMSNSWGKKHPALWVFLCQ